MCAQRSENSSQYSIGRPRYLFIDQMNIGRGNLKNFLIVN